MKHKRSGTSLRNRSLALLMAVFVAVQLAVPAYAETETQPVEQETIVTEVQQEASGEPAEAVVPTEVEEKETEVEAEVPQEEAQNTENEEPQEDEVDAVFAKAAPSLDIPGYTRVTSDTLDDTKYYLIVSVDSDGKLYAFYPDAAHKDADPGNAVDPNHRNHRSGCPEGTFVAELTVDSAKDTVTAKHAAAGQKDLNMDALLFTLEEKGSQYGFVDANKNYLSVATEMLTAKPAYLKVSIDDKGVFTIQSPTRHLDFNKAGDPHQFKNARGQAFKTNFWGPGDNRFPLYLYTKDNASVTPTVNKAELNEAIETAKGLKTEIYTEASKASLEKVLNEAIAEQQREDSTKESVAEATEKLNMELQAMRPKDELLAPTRPVHDQGTTVGEPFPAGIGGSETFRIPALITLNDGSLAAAIDARWDDCPDGFGIDTLFSRSTDGGKTWQYNFPNYFNDSVDQYWGGGKNKGNATAFLDPVMVQDHNGRIYLMTDLYSGGTFIITAKKDSGYELVDGVERMAIHYSREGSAGSYDFYVGDFKTEAGDTKAYAPLIANGDKTHTAAYYVDEYYNLYTADKRPMYCAQLGTNKKPLSGKYVQQNVFYYNADLHVRRATFLWMVTSDDNGQTWSAPTIMNPMVRERPATHRFYGVGPGAGLCLDDGTVMLTCYLHTPERSSFIYKNPDETVWHRSQNATEDRSSESTLVQIDSNTVRQFCRDEHSVLRYTDHKRNAEGKWIAQPPVEVPNVPKTQMNQLSAIRYSETINGKPVILVSTASTGTTSRQNGKIYAFNLENDEGRTMTHIGSYEVNKRGETYGYSSLTELKDGTIGLLYEDTWIHATYKNIHLNEIVPSAIINGERTVRVSQYRTVEDAFPFDELPTQEELNQMDRAIATAEIVNGKVVYTGNAVGKTSYVIGDVTVNVEVTEPAGVKEVTLDEGETMDFPVKSDKIVRNTNEKAVGATVATDDRTVTVTGGQCHTGDDKSYTGAAEPLAKGLHMVFVDGDGFRAFAKDANGADVWLNPAGMTGFPCDTEPQKIYFEQQSDGTFFIKTESRYLAFWRNGDNIYDAGSSPNGNPALYKFKLYRPIAEGETSAPEMPGYIQVKQKSEIQDGGLYLIAAESSGEHYILWPAIEGNKHAHVAKVDKKAKNVTHKVENKFYTLTVTGNTGGTSDVVFDDVIYRVTVNHDHAFGTDWNHDATGHWHECECGEKQDQAEHTFGEWTERKPATETETGLKVHSCTVCGYEETEIIPVIPAAPTDPEAPTNPQKPANPEAPTKPETPNKPAQGTNPQTGDNSHVLLWSMVSVISCLCIVVTAAYGKKKHYK